MTHSHSSVNKAEIACIVKGSVWIITLPFYIYALLKWRQFSGHFLIQKRFPKLSYTLFWIAFFGQTLSVIQALLYVYKLWNDTINHHIRYFIFSLTFTISGLVLYRINLVYLKWKSLQPAPPDTLKAINNNSQSSATSSVHHKTNININIKIPSIAKKTASITKHNDKNTLIIKPIKSIYGSRLSIIILYFVFIGSLFVYLSYSLSLPPFISYLAIIIQFGLLWIFICFSIINIKHKKVTEGIGCIKECYAILISLLIQMVLQITCPYDHAMHLLTLEHTTFFVLHFQSMITLYIPLILLLKAEGTLNIKQYHNKTDNKIFQNNDNNIDTTEIIYDVNQIDLAVVDDDNNNDDQHNNNNNNKQQIDNKPNITPSEPDSIFVHQCLFQFLYRNESNHCIFSDYLRFCFAIENLLFVERVSIFYQIVLKLQRKNHISLIRMKSPAVSRSNISTSNLTRKTSASYGILNIPTSDLSVSPDHDNKTLPELSCIDISRLSAVCMKGGNDNRNRNGSESTTVTRTNSPKSIMIITPITPIPAIPSFGDLKSSKDDINKQENNICAGLKYIYRFEFSFLKDIYDHYEQIITESITSQHDKHHNHHNHNHHNHNRLEVTTTAPDIFDITTYRTALFQICKEIYDEYISYDAANQVNLSHEVHIPLRYLFGDNLSKNGNNVDKFENYDNFLRVFDGAVIETYRLMVNVYGYRFKKYVKNIYPNTKFE